MILYGIRNCDTMKKARMWLDSHGVSYEFHDYKKDGVPAAKLKQWVEVEGWEVFLNQAGTTFRKLPEVEKQNLGAEKAMGLMLAHPSMIRRPVLEWSGGLVVGFSEGKYASFLAGG